MDALTDIVFSKPFGYIKDNAGFFGHIKTVQQYMPVLEMQVNVFLINSVMNSRLLRKYQAPTASDIFRMVKMMGLGSLPDFLDYC